MCFVIFLLIEDEFVADDKAYIENFSYKYDRHLKKKRCQIFVNFSTSRCTVDVITTNMIAALPAK